MRNSSPGRTGRGQRNSSAPAPTMPPAGLRSLSTRSRMVTAAVCQPLAASGWHTAAVTMRLLVESDLKPAGGIVGAGADEFRWPRPVRPGDELRIESEVLEVRPSRSRADQGLIKVRTTTLNQNDEAVQVIIANLVVPRRPTQGGEEATMSEHVDPAGARVSSKYRRTTAAAPTGDH